MSSRALVTSGLGTDCALEVVDTHATSVLTDVVHLVQAMDVSRDATHS